MSETNIFFKWYIMPTITLSFLLIILSFIFGMQKESECADNLMSVNTYLIGIGIQYIFSVSILLIMYLWYAMIDSYKHIIIKIRNSHTLVHILMLLSLFYYCWIIVGGIILFKTEVNCISNSANIYAIFVWSLGISQILYISCIDEYVKVVFENGFMIYTIRLNYMKNYILPMYRTENGDV